MQKLVAAALGAVLGCFPAIASADPSPYNGIAGTFSFQAPLTTSTCLGAAAVTLNKAGLPNTPVEPDADTLFFGKDASSVVVRCFPKTGLFVAFFHLTDKAEYDKITEALNGAKALLDGKKAPEIGKTGTPNESGRFLAYNTVDGRNTRETCLGSASTALDKAGFHTDQIGPEETFLVSAKTGDLVVVKCFPVLDLMLWFQDADEEADATKIAAIGEEFKRLATQPTPPELKK